MSDDNDKMVRETVRAKKWPAMEARGVEEQDIALLQTRYTSLEAIKAAGTEGLVELGFEEAKAAEILAKVRSSPGKGKTAAKKAEEVQIERMELVEDKHHVYTETEQELVSIADGKGVEIPLKVIVDIASRIEGKEVSSEDKQKLIEVAGRMCAAHKMDSHESAGVMAAHSIGEPGTQMNMRTFHFSGVANVLTTQGLPRLIEIVDARRIPSTPSMDIPLKGLAAEDENVAKKVAFEIETTALIDIADVETDDSNLCLRIIPSMRKMEARNITMDDIVERLNRIKALRGLIHATDFDIVVQSDESSFKKLQSLYDAVRNAKVKGIDGITRAVLTKDKGAWRIVTEGSNLKEVLKVEGVNVEKTRTNSVLEIADVLGIEAARNAIINEAFGTLSEAGLNVDIRHIMLVADLMTNDGYVKAIGRHGISGKKSSVLARAAFEITAPHLLHAAMNGEVDHLKGVAENIIVGQPVTVGTGAVNLVYTPKKKGDEE